MNTLFGRLNVLFLVFFVFIGLFFSVYNLSELFNISPESISSSEYNEIATKTFLIGVSQVFFIPSLYVLISMILNWLISGRFQLNLDQGFTNILKKIDIKCLLLSILIVLVSFFKNIFFRASGEALNRQLINPTTSSLGVHFGAFSLFFLSYLFFKFIKKKWSSNKDYILVLIGFLILFVVIFQIYFSS